MFFVLLELFKSPFPWDVLPVDPVIDGLMGNSHVGGKSLNVIYLELELYNPLCLVDSELHKEKYK